MKRLAQILAAVAAGLGITYATIGEGLDAELAIAERTCEDWERDATHLADPTQHIVARLVYEPAALAVFPQASAAGKLLGDCLDGTCTAKPGGCETAITYSYVVGDVTRQRDFRTYALLTVTGPAEFVGAWKQAADDEAGLTWLGAGANTVGRCASGTPLTGVQCLAIIPRPMARRIV